MAASTFKVGFGYRIALPIAAYRTWQGKILEGVGVSPHIEVAFSPEPNLHQHDSQLDASLATLTVCTLGTVKNNFSVREMQPIVVRAYKKRKRVPLG